MIGITQLLFITGFSAIFQSSQAITSLFIALGIFITINILFLILARVKWKLSRFLSSFFSKEQISISLICTLIWLYLSFPFDQFLENMDIGKLFFIFVILILIWFFLRLISVIRDIVFALYPIEKEDNLQERKIRTQFQYIQYILSFLVILVGVAVIFFQFDQLQALGAGLLASAGIAGIVIAFAAHQTLGNFLAGLQIAFAQPFRIDDVVIVEGEWGRIEEITFTYVVVRIWDQRRLVLPISYFQTHPFQNWTRTTSKIWGTIYLYVDYSTPIEKVREELLRIVKTTDLWDGEVAVLQVTDTSEKTISLRALVSARNASDAWGLRCYVREKLVVFLQNNYPSSLPRLRLDVQSEKNKKAE